VLYATGHPHLPQIAGGLQTSTHETIQLLAARGHDVRLLCGLTGAGVLGLRHRIGLKLATRPIATDTQAGYTTYRAWHPADRDVVQEIVTDFAPDIVVAQGGDVVPLVQTFDDHGVPGVIHFRNVEFEDMSGPLAALDPATGFISNSEFTRARMKQAFGIDSIIVLPVIEADRYHTTRDGTHVVFVNPHPSKGVDVALGLAEACPDIPFLFVESWTLEGPEHDAMRARAAALPNIEYQGRTKDMRAVYRRAAVMLVPSAWEEAFGRVVAEAQVSGIPAVASAIGGLPEAVGPGGLLVAPDAPVAEWTVTLRRIWDDRAELHRLSEAALAHSARRELDTSWQIDRLEHALFERLSRANVATAGTAASRTT
jgi:glycosyltransferase involved in cell wall biosynthesis